MSPPNRVRGLSRRAFLATTTVAAGSMFAPALVRAATRQESDGLDTAADARRDQLVVLFLRGGLDGLSLCAPHGDEGLQLARPKLAIPAPRSASGAVDLDGFFGLAPAARALEVPFKAGQLAIVHAAGLRQASRSHFDAMRRFEAGQVDALPVLRAGWIARLLTALPAASDAASGSSSASAGTSSSLRAVAIDRFLPQSLVGAPEALAIQDPRAFVLFAGDARLSSALRSAHAGARTAARLAAERSLDAMKLLSSTRIEPRDPAQGDAYPATELGRRLALAAAWIRARAGVEVITIDSGGWDLHRGLGPLDGKLAAKMNDLACGLAAFARDLDQDLAHTTLIVVSEFGRRVAENASLGADHGHGTCLLVLGGHVAGGRVHGTWPGLAPDKLDQGDLAITTDVRDVLAEIATRRMGVRDVEHLFPGHVLHPAATALLV